MHPIFRNLVASFFATNGAIDRLLGSNEAPSHEERAEILSGLRNLEVELEWLSGPPYAAVADREGGIRPPQTEKTYQSICEHLFVLSSVRYIPSEVWQRVFELVVFDPTMQGCDPLHLLTRVSRRWYAVATTHQILWSILPKVSHLNIASPITSRRHSAIRSRLQLFLSRSGSNEIDFRLLYSSSEDVWRANKTSILDILDTLVEVSHRWRKAVLDIPAEIVERGLAPLRIHGRLPSLEELQLGLSVWGLEWEELQIAGKLIRVDHFNDAPNLRHIALNTYVVSVPALSARILKNNNTTFDFHLPWSQIETYQSRIATTGNDESYRRLIQQGSHERLREVVHAPGMGHRPFPTMVTPTILSPSLVKLCLQLGHWHPGDHLIMHLRKLVLPSLTELEAYGAYFVQRPDDDLQWPTLYDAVITLIQHSGCSDALIRLRLDEKVRPRSVDQLQELFFLCPNLEYLDVRVLQDRELQTLRLGTNLPEFLPDLKVLSLRWPSEHTYHESVIPVFRGRKPPLVEPSTLWDVVQSRTSTPAQQTSQLQEVRLLISSFSDEEYGVLNKQMNLLIGDSAWPFPAGSWASTTLDYEGLSQLRTALQQKFKPIDRIYSTNAHENSGLHQEMDGVMRKLDELDLGECQGLILARIGVLYHLDEIARSKERAIPGDSIHSFRSRAAKLLERWKPIILPQFKTLSHRWCYVPLGSSRLQCQPKLNPNTEDLVWRDAVGYAIE